MGLGVFLKKTSVKILIAALGAFFIIISVLVVCNKWFIRPTVVNQNESLLLSCETDEKTSGFSGFTANFPWEKGSVRYKVDSCELYDSSKSVGSISNEEQKYLEESHYFTELDKKMYGEPVFLLLTITMENVNAEFGKEKELYVNFCNLFPSDVFYDGKTNYEFYTSEAIYFDKHKPFKELEENEYKNYFAISCEDFKPGESLQFKLGFYIDEKTAKNDDMILSIGLSDKRKYGIKLKISEVING